MAEVSKTARASMVAKTYQDKNYLTNRVCGICGDRISLGTMLAVKVVGKGMRHYHTTCYNK